MTHADVIDQWNSIAAFAEDIGVAYGTAKAMRRRNSIPPEYWIKVVQKAADRSLEGVSLQVLAVAVCKTEEAAE
ncbi:hypothetical protein [Agrobacterium tumefaciens]|uniref:hypothetical protein n=1 Tax=Agrobacterium tumefaciens TaxID=358 RepID=UPI003B9FA03D